MDDAKLIGLSWGIKIGTKWDDLKSDGDARNPL